MNIEMILTVLAIGVVLFLVGSKTGRRVLVLTIVLVSLLPLVTVLELPPVEGSVVVVLIAIFMALFGKPFFKGLFWALKGLSRARAVDARTRAQMRKTRRVALPTGGQPTRARTVQTSSQPATSSSRWVS